MPERGQRRGPRGGRGGNSKASDKPGVQSGGRVSAVRGSSGGRGRGGRGGASRGRGRGRGEKKLTKEELDKQLEGFLMKDEETRERVTKLKQAELDSALEKYMAKAEDEEAAPTDAVEAAAAAEAAA